MFTQKINRVLAVILLAALFGIGIATLVTKGTGLAYAFFVTYTQYTDENASGIERVIDGVKARITALNSALNINLVGRDWFQKWNARWQLLLGKEVLNFGGTTMVRLKTGQLYDLAGGSDVQDDVQRMGRVKAMLDERGIPMVFVYAHGSLYEDGLLPDGISDSNLKVADAIVNGMREEGIDTLDSREILKGENLSSIIFGTDQHWTPLAAFRVFGAVLKELNRTTELSLDESLGDPENYSIELLEKAHLGDVGARVGAGFIRLDDFPLITPKFDTKIHQKISSSHGAFVERDGSFEEAVLNMDVLDAGRGKGNIYDTYGYHTEVVYYDNENAKPGRILIIKDSFGTPVASFMSLAAQHICALDLRKGRGTIEEYVDSFKPDAVVIVHCQEMFRGRNYVFVD